MGSENFKFKIRNINEDMIFKNEDDIYKLDIQIEMFKKCHDVVQAEIELYDSLPPQKQQVYEFPWIKLRPMMHYWERKYSEAFKNTLMLSHFKFKFLKLLRDGMAGKLQELQNQRLDLLPHFEDVFRKNFIKSLDHRSFQYKDFMKKAL